MKKHHRSLSWAPALLLAAPFVCTTANAAIIAKQLAGGPEEFATMAPANPIQSATHSKSALLPVTLNKSANGRFGWEAELPVEGGNMRFAAFTGGKIWNMSMQDPVSGRVQPIEQIALSKRQGSFGLSDNGYSADMYTLENIPQGGWKLRVDADEAGRGFVLLEGGGSERLMSYQVALNQRAGQRIGMVASVYDLDGGSIDGLREASLQVTAPDGALSKYAMFDDGLHQDGSAGDGTYGADFLAEKAGDFNAQVIVRGTNEKGFAFVRTSEHLIPVIDDQLSIGALRTSAKLLDANRFSVRVPLTVAKAASDHYHAYAEVWGTAANGKRMVPIAWIGGMTDLAAGGIDLGLDARWIGKAGARAPFELRNLRIEDADHFIAVAAADKVALALPALPKSARSPVTQINDEMRMGPRPAMAKGTGSRLLLVHGYCSGNVWGGVSGQFANASVFQDLNKNRTHDAFARLIQTFGATWNSFGIVAHSQGGAASLHLYNFYWSGLDNAPTNKRLIQSVGTPYRGTALAGNAAALGNVFGVGCGTNSNMTYSGASSWLAGISTASRAKVNFSTTSFTDRAWLPDHCNVVTDLLLGDPEDGTTEKTYGQLPSGVNQGHKTGWCHTSGMRDPAQTTDSSRNATMSANAAR